MLFLQRIPLITLKKKLYFYVGDILWIWHKFGDPGIAELSKGIENPLEERMKTFNVIC